MLHKHITFWFILEEYSLNFWFILNSTKKCIYLKNTSLIVFSLTRFFFLEVWQEFESWRINELVIGVQSCIFKRYLFNGQCVPDKAQNPFLFSSTRAQTSSRSIALLKELCTKVKTLHLCMTSSSFISICNKILIFSFLPSSITSWHIYWARNSWPTAHNE